MFDQIHTILDEVNEFESSDLKQIEAFRISYLGKKGKPYQPELEISAAKTLK